MEMTKWVLVLGLVLASPVNADGQLTVLAMLRPATPPRASDPAPPPPARTDGPMEIRYQRIAVDIQDHVAITRVNQQFKNNLNAVVEGQYQFRLVPDASVSDFAIWDGDTRVAGVVRRKEEARAVYDAIRHENRDPGLLEQVGDNLFQAKVFPILPLADKKIEIEYREALRVEDGTACYRYPLARAQGSGAPVNELVITLDIKDGAEVAAAWSPTPGVAVHHHDAHRVTVSYEVQRALPASDLLVYYTVKRPLAGMRVRTHRADAEPGYLQLSIAPPVEGLPPRPKDVVFVVDTSGSMKGAKIEQARTALKYCLNTLQPDDRFAVLRFSTDVEPMAPRLTEATAKAIAEAGAWVSRLEPAGGTNIDGALTGALATFTGESDARPRYLVFLTDGQPTVGNTDPTGILGHARVSNPARARVFTFGIDEAAGMPLLAGLAREHRGETISVTGAEDLSSALPLFFGKLTVPLFEDAALAWEGVGVSSVHPKTLPHFYLGRQVTVVGRYRAPGAGKVVLTAKVDGKPVRYELPVVLPEKEAGGGALPRLWAQQEVDALVNGQDPASLNAELKEEIVRLSIAHVFATPFTSFIAVPEAEKRQLPPDLRKVLDSADHRISRVSPGGGEELFQLDAEGNLAPVPRVTNSEAEREFQQALAADRDGRARDTFVHAKNAIRIAPEYKRRFRNVLRNAAVSRRISSVVSEIIEKSEEDQLTDAEVEKYAKKFQQMLGESRSDLRTMKVLKVRDAKLEQAGGYYNLALNKDVGSIRTNAGPAPVAGRPPAAQPSADPAPAMDRAYRDLQQQVASVRLHVRLLKARLAALGRGATDPAKLGAYVEAARTEPALVPGGGHARLALTVRCAADRRPQVVWRAGSGRLTETSAAGATWEAPVVPGLHEIAVDLVDADGTRTTHVIEMVVLEPGRITYAPGFLEARTQELEAALGALKADRATLSRELEALVKRLTPAVAKAIEAMVVLTAPK